MDTTHLRAVCYGLVKLQNDPTRLTISARIQAVHNLRGTIEFLSKQYGERLSDAAVSDLIDDLFHRILRHGNIEDLGVLETLNKGLDPKTIGNLRSCQLDLNVRRIHPRTIRVLDAFCFAIVPLKLQFDR